VSVSKVGGKFGLLEQGFQQGGEFQRDTEDVMASERLNEQATDEQQQAEAQRIYDRLGPIFEEERRRLANLLASKGNHELFGQTEYEVRDRVHHLGAKALETAADERQKKGRVRGC
jgi:hypothetical protein